MGRVLKSTTVFLLLLIIANITDGQDALAKVAIQSCLRESFRAAFRSKTSKRKARDSVRTLLWGGIEWSLSGDAFVHWIEAIPQNAIIAAEFPANRRGEEPITLIGNVSRFQVSPSDFLFSISDSAGNVHLLSPHRRYRIKQLDPARDQKIIEQQGLFEVEKTPLDHNEAAIQKAICAGLSKYKRDPLFQKLRKTVDSAFSRSRRNVSSHFSGCLLIIPAAGLKRVYFEEHRYDARLTDNRDWVSEHGSNYFGGLGYLSGFSCLLNAAKLKNPNHALAIALGANIVGNIWEEIQLPDFIPQRSLPLFATSGQPVNTDLEDFKSGVLAALTYLVAVKTIEQAAGAINPFRCSSTTDK